MPACDLMHSHLKCTQWTGSSIIRVKQISLEQGLHIALKVNWTPAGNKNTAHTWHPGGHRDRVRSNWSLNKRTAKNAPNYNSEDETMEKEKQCDFTIFSFGSITFYEQGLMVLYKFKHFNTMKMPFLP